MHRCVKNSNKVKILLINGGQRLSIKEHLFFLEGKHRSLERKKRTLNELFKSGRISHPIYSSYDEDISSSLFLVNQRIEKVEGSIKSRILNLEEEASLLERMISDLEMLYRLNRVEERRYSLNMSRLLAGLDSIKDEIRNLSNPSKSSILEDSELRHRETSKMETEDASSLKTDIPPIKLGIISKKRRMKYSTKREMNLNEKRKEVPEVESGLICKNPWDKKCRNTDVEVFIYYGGEYVPICSDCWKRIVEKDLSW
ncbi:MAG: CdvA-like protein [Candidatus Bathyarchaeia archaeon]